MKPKDFKIGDSVSYINGEVRFSGEVTQIREDDIRIKYKNCGPSYSSAPRGILVDTEDFQGNPYVFLKKRLNN